MNREETKKIVMIVIASFPNWHPDDLSFTVDTWNLMLSEYEYNDIALALKTYISTNSSGFAPSIGQLIDKLQTVHNIGELNEMEAWALVSNALRNGYYGAEEEFAKLPPIIQKAVGQASNLRNWSQTDMESIENVIQSNFIKTYRTELARQKEYRKMPSEVRTLIEQTQQKLLGGNDK